jgi:hypothetical protein
MGQVRNAYKTSIEKPEETGPLTRPRWEDNNGMSLREIV